MRISSLILASGSGSRLYPISTEDHPKQFLPLLDENELMVNIMSRRFKRFVDDQYIVTLNKYKKFIPFIKGNVLTEPQRAGTGFSVLSGLLGIKEENEDGIVIQAPSDLHIGDQDELDRAISEGIKKCMETNKIILIGEKPTKDESDYGYFWKENNQVYFHEKPSLSVAARLIDKGAYWNTAIYIYRLSTMLELFRKLKTEIYHGLLLVDKGGMDEMALVYNIFNDFSFEESILMNTNKLDFVEASMGWEDIGTIKRLNKVRGEHGREKIEINRGVNKGM